MDSWVFKRLFKRAYENGKPFFGDLLFDIGDIFKEVFVRFPRHLWNFARRVWEYLPILYNDVDYDYIAILRMLQYKIKRTRKHIVEHKMISDWHKVEKSCLQAEQLIEAILEDDYAKEEYIQHDEKWGKMRMTGIDKDGNDGTYVRWLRLNVNTDVEKKQELKELKQIWRLELRRKTLTWKKLWNTIDKNIHTWWD